MNHRIFERTWRFRKSSGSMLVSVSVATLQRRLVCKSIGRSVGTVGFRDGQECGNATPSPPGGLKCTCGHAVAGVSCCSYELRTRCASRFQLPGVVVLRVCLAATQGGHGAQPAPSVWLGCASPEHTKSCVAWEAASHAVCRAREVHFPPTPPLTPQFNDRT